MRMRAPWPIALVLTCLPLWPALAPAAPAAAESAASLDKPAERRSGVVLGTSVGLGLAGSSGYPNDSTKINNPDFYSRSNLLVGPQTSIFFMGALADYLNFGFMVSFSTMHSDSWRSTGGGVGFRLEVFPLYHLVPTLKDLGVQTQLGVGFTSLQANGNYPGADGTQSFLGLGAFYEWKLAKLLGGHVAGGPTVEYDAIVAQSIERHTGMIGARLVFYGGI